MIANVSAHRRANAFAQALEEQSVPGATAEQPDEPAEQADHGPLLALANGLGELPRPELDPEVKVVQRAQLVAAMEAMLTEGGASAGPTVPEQRTKGSHRASPLRKLRPRSRWTKGLAAGGLTVGVAAGAFGGVAAASSDALPGDSLYGLKRGMEDLHLGMTSGDTDRGKVYLDQASTRLNEARRLMERARSGDLDHEQLGEIRRTLNGMTHDATEGHRLLSSVYRRDGAIGPIQALDSFSRSHRESWSSLRDRLPVQLTDIGDQVNSVFDAMDEEIEPLQSLLPRTPGSDEDTRRSDTTERGTRPSRTAASTAPSSPEASRERTDDSTAPHPSGSGSASSDGLISGGTDGLFGTPPPGADPSSDGRTDVPPASDVTLPPLLPGLLPGLGINGEDAND
ncbi:DUF5667 domain-containing protein [Streptomyces sp. ML-6]|uniref:DUF5667 domain-containing protein n=1 Tax=Streptomyces sp. ML-6 TaxID=2982693 RepID=UPI0024BF128B|nr:DUF5667 domain-containing protein [Streptomyces sp. ML-6]MDK0520226.1 DUF5667 domain-containing protein [Streptomyces sp. ML-6]